MNIYLPKIELITEDARKVKIKNRKSFSWYNIICTWFLIGQLGLAPGTIGSLATFPVYYFVLHVALNNATSVDWITLAQVLLWIFTIILFLIGSVALSKFQEETNTMDHKSVVIDEVVGMLLTLAISFKWLLKSTKFFSSILGVGKIYVPFLVALVLFRIFDIWKPLIIGMIDSRYKNTLGVMLDDVVAALFSSLSIWVIYSWFIK